MSNRYKVTVFFTDHTSVSAECDDLITNENGFSYAMVNGIKAAIFPHANVIYMTVEKINQAKPTQDWNTGCKYYGEDSTGERSCSCGMDMIFCTKNCAFATNTKGSTKAYEATVYENHRAVPKRKRG